MTVTIKSIFHLAIHPAKHVFQIEFVSLEPESMSVSFLSPIFCFQIDGGYDRSTFVYGPLPLGVVEFFYAILYPTFC